MVSRSQLLSSFLLTLLFFAGSGAAQDVSSSCEAAIDRDAGTYSRCLLRAQARDARRPNAPRLESAEQRCADRFDAATDRALARAEHREETCTPFLKEIANRTVSNAEEVATEASGKPALSLLYVQSATGSELTESTLKLTGVNSETSWFADRPHRDAGRVPTLKFLELFSVPGANSWAVDSPNAFFVCEADEVLVKHVVTLQAPAFDELTDTLTYSITFVTPSPFEGGSSEMSEVVCDMDANLFIDSRDCDCPDSICAFFHPHCNRVYTGPCTWVHGVCHHD